MRKLISLIKREWEKSLFWLSLAALTLMFLMRLMPFNESSGSTSDSKKIARVESFLGTNALAFLGVTPTPSVSDQHAFAFDVKVPEKDDQAKGKWPWQKTKKPAPAATPVATPTVAPKPVVTKPTVAPKPVAPTPQPKPVTPKPPPKPKQIRMVEYRGIYIGTTGEKRALVQVRDPANKKSSGTTGFLATGQKIGGLQVAEFDESRLVVNDPNGEAKDVKKGSQIKVVLD